MLVSELLSASLRKIGALSSGETLETSRQNEALSALQSMLRSWGSLSTNVFVSTKETVSLVSGRVVYTWGMGGQINSVRPYQVLGAFIRDIAGQDHSVNVITESAYRDITLKSLSGRPYSAFFHQTYPLGSLYVFPVAVDAEELHLETIKPFTETSSFSAVGNTLAFPGYYEEAIIFNLAIRLAPEYGKTVAAEVTAIAHSSYNYMITRNAIDKSEPVAIHVPAGLDYGSYYSINTDTYR